MFTINGFNCKVYEMCGFKKALLQNPQRKIRGRIFRAMVRIRARKSELQAESRSYRPKVRVNPQNPNRIAQKRPRMGLGASTETPPQSPLEST